MTLSCIDLLDVISKWSYFVICILSLINCFIHLHLQLEAYQCKSPAIDGTGNCIGRNLVWLTNGSGLRTDINYLYWRQIFSLQPEIFFNVWTPFIFSILAFAQNFKGFQCPSISGTWLRCFLFIVFWMLFGVIGFGANWGIFTGFLGFLGLAIMYLVMTVMNRDEKQMPVFQFDISPCLDIFGVSVSNDSSSGSNKNPANYESANVRENSKSHSQSESQYLGLGLSVVEDDTNNNVMNGNDRGDNKNNVAEHEIDTRFYVEQQQPIQLLVDEDTRPDYGVVLSNEVHDSTPPVDKAGENATLYK